MYFTHLSFFFQDESESESEDESEPEESEAGPADGLQTPSGLETPSGMHSVVSTVPGGLETPDFLELRKGRETSEVADTGPRSLYQVVPERQTSVRGLMGSERGYDVAAVTQPGMNLPVLGDERGTKVRRICLTIDITSSERSLFIFFRVKIAKGERCGPLDRCIRIGKSIRRPAACAVRGCGAWFCWCARWREQGGLFRYGGEDDVEEAEDGERSGDEGEGEGVQVLIVGASRLSAVSVW